jgi:hypothetical protein
MKNMNRKSPVGSDNPNFVASFVANFVANFVDKARDKVMAWWSILLAFILLGSICQGRARRSEPPSTSLVRAEDIVIFDEQELQTAPKGWTIPADFLKAYTESLGYNGSSGILEAIRTGNFGQTSDRWFYTTWREIAPLTNQAYAEGKTSIFDGHVSNMITPPFEIKLDYITFLISGGNMPDKACINLLIDGKIVRTATGNNQDLLEWAAFEVKEFRGKQASIQVLDTSTAALGYITVDCVCQSPDPKGATRVISLPPSGTSGVTASAETLAGRISGNPEIAEGKLRIAGKDLNLQDLLQWDNAGVPAAAANGKRVLLTNGDSLAADVVGLEDKKLVLRHAVFGEMRLPIADVAQVLFQPGPASDAAPGTLIHSNGNKIPGELMWIRGDNISINCSLGALPLPRARVIAFVFSKTKPAATTADSVALADGSTLTGKLSLDKETLLLTHNALGPVKLSLPGVARITRGLSGVTPLESLKGEVMEQAGPIPPPSPLRVQNASGDALRMFPRTAMRFKLPAGNSNRRFLANLASVANSRTPMTAILRAGSNTKTIDIPADSSGVSVSFDIGSADEIEIVTDSAGTVSYPCGIEWRNAIIVEQAKP